MNELCKDVMFLISHKMTLFTLENFRAVSKYYYMLYDDDFYFILAECLYSKRFWKLALSRHEKDSKPLSTWREELIRIETFQSAILKFEGRTWDEEEFITFWDFEKKNHAKKMRLNQN